MKISTTPTEQIAIAARNNSEWDSVDFVIVNLNEAWIRLLSERLECLTLVKESKSFAGLRYWDNADAWYMYTDDITEELEGILSEKEWCYIDITEEEIEQLTSPEQRIDGETMRVHIDGSFCFVGYGKHTNEEFWTSDVPTDAIIKDFKNSLVLTN